ncbi:hypothetical protein D3C81_1080200 [compost metagenome]
MYHRAEQAACGEQDQGAVVFQGDQGFEKRLSLHRNRCSRRLFRDSGHQENTEERDGRCDQERRAGEAAGNQHTEHRPDRVADVGQRIAQGKRLGALAHGQIVAEDRFRTDQEQCGCGFGDDQSRRGQVEVLGKRQQHQTDGAGKHGEDQQPTLFETIDDVAAIQRQQGGDEHGDAEQQTNVLLVEVEFVADEQREQRAGDGAADDDGQRADQQAADEGGVSGHGVNVLIRSGRHQSNGQRYSSSWTPGRCYGIYWRCSNTQSFPSNRPLRCKRKAGPASREPDNATAPGTSSADASFRETNSWEHEV